MRNLLASSFLLILLFSVFHCNRRMKCKKSIPLDAVYFKINAKVAYQDSHHKPAKFSIQIRIEKDKLIWFSITSTLGIKVMRGLITPKKTMIIDYLQKQSFSYDFLTLAKKSHIQYDFNILQSILLREAPMKGATSTSQEHHAGKTIIKQMFHHLLVKSKSLFSELESQTFHSTQHPTELSIQYEPKNKKGFTNAKVYFSYSMPKDFFRANATIKKLCIKILIDKPTFPFNIPKSYVQK